MTEQTYDVQHVCVVCECDSLYPHSPIANKKEVLQCPQCG